mgnify:CR=1 FL=1
MAAGQQITYSGTLAQKRVVTARIVMIEPMEFVAVNALGIDNAGKFAFVNTPGEKYEWLEDVWSARTDTLVGGLSASSTTTTFTATDGTLYQPGDVFLIESEYFWVSSISADVITVGTRSFGGTQATHADNLTITFVGRARLEGAAAADGHFTQPTSGYNYSATFQKTLEISRTNALLKVYGIENVIDREINKKLEENLRLLNLAIYHGQRKAGSATTPRMFGGLKALITTNDPVVSGALTRKRIEDSVADCWTEGGRPSLILTNQWGKRKIASFYEGFVTTERSEMMGGVEISKSVTPLGLDLSVAVDRDCPTDSMFLLDIAKVGALTIDPFFSEPLGKTKDTAFYGQVVGEYGFVLQHEKAHAHISGFSVTV